MAAFIDYEVPNSCTDDGEDSAMRHRPSLRCGVASVAGLLLVIVAAVGLVGRSQIRGSAESGDRFLATAHLIGEAGTDQQHIFVVRHGDKYAEYPPCGTEAPGELCYNATLMGINPPLTPCGISQAEHTKDWLLHETRNTGGISHIVVSPFTRTLQTALPLAKALLKPLKVDYLVSEARQPDGPFRAYNAWEDALTVQQLEEVQQRWDLTYGSFPIPTPEDFDLYNKRVALAAQMLHQRFPPDSGNVAIYTHATTAFSVAYGLCHEGSEALQAFIERQKAIGPAGVIHIVRDKSGKCLSSSQTQNVGLEVGCGRTPPFKCEFADCPDWYWAHERGLTCKCG
eukprot:TRINITY_DN45086_c0_g1_i1.p1 TRINITY_DN45086_c0_g1~~TRINITY_DN45086_c0_g1_i1.p1  ORF type:complete len:341 (+),score=54.98 TRINITY_DN45086_c0_g1_i1:69-1091(+)